jgi:RNA polymerase sigma-70 factor (ECF subfamily)
VAINRLRDGHRARQRRERAEDRAVDRVAVRPDADLVAEAPGEWDVVRRALARLPERQRIAVALYYVEDLSVRDIAMSMRITEGAVKAHLSQGRSKLAAVLVTPEPEPEEVLQHG